MQHRDGNALFDILGIDHRRGNGAPRVAPRKDSGGRTNAWMRAEEKRIATMAAELSVWSDRRLLGIPHVRWLIVDRAVYLALGLEFDLKGAKPEEWGLHPQSLLVVLDALEAARSAAVVAVDSAQNKVISAH